MNSMNSPVDFQTSSWLGEEGRQAEREREIEKLREGGDRDGTKASAREFLAFVAADVACI